MIFDFDGTLADSFEHVLSAYNELAPLLRVRRMERDALPRLRRMSPPQLLREQQVAFWKLPLLVQLMRRALRAHAAELAPCAGVAPMLHALAERGARCYILSTNANDNIARFLARHELAMFTRVVGGVSMFGKARALLRLMRAEQLPPSSAYYVGDEVRDIAAASAVNIKSIAVSWGYADRGALAAARPSLLLDDPEELTRALLEGLGEGQNANH